MRYILFILLIIQVVVAPTLSAQNAPTDADRKALEGIIVERYYVADASDCADTTGGILAKGSVTYRIYIDLKPDYTLQVVYGDKNHPLKIQTTTTFYNNSLAHAANGYNVHPARINENNIALDSWLSVGAATRDHAGILLADDKDGSIIKKKALEKADGLAHGNLALFKPFNLDLAFFNEAQSDSLFTTDNGGWAAFSGNKSGAKGPTVDNRILIAQLTTDGKLSFKLNIQVGTPAGGTIRFVADNPSDNEVQFTELSYPFVK